MNANSNSGWWLVNLVFEIVGEKQEHEQQLTERRVAVTVRCEHWREAFWKARRMGLDMEQSQKDLFLVGIHSMTPIAAADTDLSILSSVLVTTWRERKDLLESCISDYDLAQTIEENRHPKELNPDELDSNESGF